MSVERGLTSRSLDCGTVVSTVNDPRGDRGASIPEKNWRPLEQPNGRLRNVWSVKTDAETRLRARTKKPASAGDVPKRVLR